MKSLNEFKNWQPHYSKLLKEYDKKVSDLSELIQWLIDRFESTRENLLKQSESEINKWIKILPQTDAVICDEIQKKFKDLPKSKPTINQEKLLALKAKAQKLR
jgi:hypothetical protein